MTTHLVRVPIRVAALARWAGDRGWARRRGGGESFDEGRALHHLTAETFGPGALRPFRLLVPPGRGRGSLYAYSARDAATLRETAGAAAGPEHLGVLRLHDLASKPMPEDWRVGQRLGFDLRARPIRRLRGPVSGPDGTICAGSEIDAFLLEALRGHSTEAPRRGEPGGMEKAGRSREAVYLDWLAERLAPAAELDREASRLVRFRRVRAARLDRSSENPCERAAEGPDATIHGVLAVADPAAFAALLARGVGRHRAYGYGMLLLRPPGRAAPDR